MFLRAFSSAREKSPLLLRYPLNSTRENKKKKKRKKEEAEEKGEKEKKNSEMIFWNVDTPVFA